MNYNWKKREELIHRVEHQPSQNWHNNTIPWQFGSQQSVFGSPMFDAANGVSQSLIVGELIGYEYRIR